jgi:cytochrome c oxidase cbb3-type subunit III
MKRAGLAVMVLLLTAWSCEREERDYRPEAEPAQDTSQVTVSGLRAGGGQPASPGYPEYTENAYHVAEGKRLFQAFNCNGCHAHGGGGMGPPLMDAIWIYGSEPENIHATIVEGRPNGMPSFRNRIPDQQVWELAAYVRSMAGLLRKDVAGGRSDDLYPGPPEQSRP